eukprot:scaffold54104_cov56-Phaeocystis_antarctica.AAC.4
MAEALANPTPTPNPNANPNQVTGMAEALAAEGGGAFDIVVNNAGYFWEQEETLSNLSPAEQLKQIDVCSP